MTALVLMGIAVAMIGVAAAIVRRRRTAAALRGDWWDGFERDFYAYVCRTPQVKNQDESEDDQDGFLPR